MSYDQRLKTLVLYSVKGRLANLIKCWKIFNGMSAITPTDLFTMTQVPGCSGGKARERIGGDGRRGRPGGGEGLR